MFRMHLKDCDATEACKLLIQSILIKLSYTALPCYIIIDLFVVTSNVVRVHRLYQFCICNQIDNYFCEMNQWSHSRTSYMEPSAIITSAYSTSDTTIIKWHPKLYCFSRHFLCSAVVIFLFSYLNPSLSNICFTLLFCSATVVDFYYFLLTECGNGLAYVVGFVSACLCSVDVLWLNAQMD